MSKLKFAKTEMIEKTDHATKRYPNLNTVLMVEDFLKRNRNMPIKISDLKRKLPRQVMHQTLKIILQYLFISGKIIYGPKGVQWIYSEPEHFKKMMKGSLEI
ncbi:MAG: hypothetical protein ABIF08_01545 [Nanoarchaeota archaeon]